MRGAHAIVSMILATGVLAACSSQDAPEGLALLKNVAPQAVTLTRFGVDPDGTLPRARLIAGLRTEFAAADTDHDGTLSSAEVAAVNERRWKKDRESASLLIDWNHDRVVDFNEFATTDLSLFDQFDSNGDGVVSRLEFMGLKRK